jgi:hypothetical protein
MGVIIQAVAAFAGKSRTIGARLWRGLREPRMVPVRRELPRTASRNHARFVIFR